MHPLDSARERRVDGYVHALGVAASVGAVAFLMFVTTGHLDGVSLASLAIYGIGLMAMVGFSAGYNLATRPRWRSLLRRLDHAAIFLMIAGTYTPFALVKMGGIEGHWLVAAVWVAAVVGVAVKLLLPGRFERASYVLYLVQGWAVLATLDPLVSAVSMPVLVLLLAGGGLYTVGIAFHLWERLPYNTAIWHGFVLAGAGCHYVAVLDAVALPAAMG